MVTIIYTLDFWRKVALIFECDFIYAPPLTLNVECSKQQLLPSANSLKTFESTWRKSDNEWTRFMSVYLWLLWDYLFYLCTILSAFLVCCTENALGFLCCAVSSCSWPLLAFFFNALGPAFLGRCCFLSCFSSITFLWHFSSHLVSKGNGKELQISNTLRKCA